jgi:hypothetical protein
MTDFLDLRLDSHRPAIDGSIEIEPRPSSEAHSVPVRRRREYMPPSPEEEAFYARGDWSTFKIDPVSLTNP